MPTYEETYSFRPENQREISDQNNVKLQPICLHGSSAMIQNSKRGAFSLAAKQSTSKLRSSLQGQIPSIPGTFPSKYSRKQA